MNNIEFDRHFFNFVKVCYVISKFIFILELPHLAQFVISEKNFMYKIEKGNGECVKATTTRP